MFDARIQVATTVMGNHRLGRAEPDIKRREQDQRGKG
jgi:hypothetical protein